MKQCPFTEKTCSKECALYQQREKELYSGCAFNLIADNAVSELVNRDRKDGVLPFIDLFSGNSE